MTRRYRVGLPQLGWPIVALAATACTALTPVTNDDLQEPGAAKLQVVLDPSVKQLDDQARAAWSLYGATKLGLIARSPDGFDDYPIEVVGRETMAAFWEQRPAEGRTPNAYLDTLVVVKRAGHLEEYVLVTLSRPGWTLPGDALSELDIAAFGEWASANLIGHRMETLAGVKRGESFPSPPIPGDDLPKFEELTSGESLCKELPRASSAFEAWRDQERALQSIALVGRDRPGFLAALGRVLAAGASKGRGVTWVSPKAADLSFLVGFCEADRNDIASSVVPLETAVRLDPLIPMWRLELSTALIGVRRFDAAAREIESAMVQTDDPCILAAAWRKRGFLGIERGRLDDAERSYRKSLEYDPQSDLAKQELQIIEQERAKKGELSPGPYVPPPSMSPLTKRCPGK